MALWQWNAIAQRYIVTIEGASALGRKAGTFVSVEDLTGARQVFIDQQKQQAQTLVDRLVNNEINITQWTLQMREQAKQAHVTQYMLAAGGKNHMTQADYGRLGNAIRDQYGFLNNFANDILSGNLSEAQIRARANLYLNASNASFERGKVAGRTSGRLSLPAYPADGGTVCGANCKCRWHIDEMDNAWWCYWRLSPAEHCPGCQSNANSWNPLVVSK